MSQAVPFFSFQDAPADLKAEWNTAVNAVISSDRFIGGPIVESFESEWATYLGSSHAIGVGNGYDALFIAMKILEIGPGDLVAVPAHTFLATWLAVHAVGAVPIGIDCDESGLLDLEALEKHAQSFKAIIPVHMHGLAVDMRRLMAWAKPKGIFVVEDCAQAHGAKTGGKFVGTWGDIGAFSFYPTKNLGALGDAGAMVTNNDELAKKIRSFRNYGSRPENKYQYMSFGVNSRLDPIQASFLSVNLKYLDPWNDRRKAIAAKYLHALNNLGIRSLYSGSNSVWHHFAILVNERELVSKTLNANGIGTEVHYPQSASTDYSSIVSEPSPDFPVADFIARHILSLPISQWMNDSQVDAVIQALDQESLRNSFLGEMK
jgi:dTDP-4-amino-4,6-dideoxygalactose transaminase